MINIAFQGKKGAYSELAALRFFNEDIQTQGHLLSEEVCDAVENDEVAMGILPVENSIVGNVTINIDLLYKHKFFVVGETYLPIRHCLLAKRGSDLSKIKTAHSHPIALAQCREFLMSSNITPVTEHDTAGSAELISSLQDETKAVIASELCSKHYNLDILSDKIQKVTNNYTRFLIFVKEKNIPDVINQEKTSIAFSLNHSPGALLSSLQKFSEHNLNLTKIESRPIPENPFAYVFFVDFLGRLTDKNVVDCLKELKENTKSIKILGSYPEGKRESPLK